MQDRIHPKGVGKMNNRLFPFFPILYPFLLFKNSKVVKFSLHQILIFKELSSEENFNVFIFNMWSYLLSPLDGFWGQMSISISSGNLVLSPPHVWVTGQIPQSHSHSHLRMAHVTQLDSFVN